MYCPVCGYEYRDGIEECTDCGVKLTIDAESENRLGAEGDSCKRFGNKEFNPNEKQKTVYTAADEFEAEVVIAKLKAEGIYAFKKFRSSDGYGRIILGRTVLGVEIVVAKSDYTSAREIVYGR